jgi:3-oxoacyl-(acyl-carrier-protein) synthase
MSGCVTYSRRFYDEILDDPGTASPIIFPETVFNAPSSHIAALLGARGLNYTLVGDPGMFLVGLAMAADWLGRRVVDGCLVIGAEENDWLTADAFRLFEPGVVLAEGAGALFLRRGLAESPGIGLVAVTDAHSFTRNRSREQAARLMRGDLPGAGPSRILYDGICGLDSDRAETTAWSDWSGPRISPKLILGEGLAAGSAWQCVAAVQALQQQQARSGIVSVVGCNQQAIGAEFEWRTGCPI